VADALRQQIIEILDDHNHMTIATMRAEGFPQATMVSYVHKGLNVYFGCGTDSQKAKNILQHNKVSLAVAKDWEDWDAIKSLSMGGFADKVDELGEFEEVRQLVFSKFP